MYFCVSYLTHEYKVLHYSQCVQFHYSTKHDKALIIKRHAHPFVRRHNTDADRAPTSCHYVRISLVGAGARVARGVRLARWAALER